MLELIFQGFAEWIYQMILECWEYFLGSLISIMGMDLAYLKSHIPIMEPLTQIMLAVGWALLLGNLIFQATKTMMTGIGFEGEDPKLLFTRTFVFSFLLVASPQICALCLTITSTVVDIVEMPDAVSITLPSEDLFGGIGTAWILVIICGILIMFQSFKLIFEMAERYFILAVLTMTAPLAFGMGGSRNTSDIFNGWCRMYGSMCLLMVMNVVFVKMLLSVLSYTPTGLDVLPWMVLVFTVVKVAKEMDGILARIGLNPAITGDSLGRPIPGALTYAVMRSVYAQVTKAAGKGYTPKGGGGGTTPNPSNKPPNGGPLGGGAAQVTQGAVSQTQQTQHQASQATSQQTQYSSPQIATQQKNTGAQHPGATSNTQQGTEKHTYSNTSQGATSYAQGGASKSRKTMVPKGTQRSPSYVKQAVQTMQAAYGGTAAMGSMAMSTIGDGAGNNGQGVAPQPQQAGMANIGASVQSKMTSPNGTVVKPSIVPSLLQTKQSHTGQTRSAANGTSLKQGTAGSSAPIASQRYTQVTKNHDGDVYQQVQARETNTFPIRQNQTNTGSPVSQPTNQTPPKQSVKPEGGPTRYSARTTERTNRSIQQGFQQNHAEHTIATHQQGTAGTRETTAAQNILHENLPAAKMASSAVAVHLPTAPATRSHSSRQEQSRPSRPHSLPALTVPTAPTHRGAAITQSAKKYGKEVTGQPNPARSAQKPAPMATGGRNSVSKGNRNTRERPKQGKTGIR